MKAQNINRGRKADYTDRPLTDEERAFASDENNYNQLFKFMRVNLEEYISVYGLEKRG